MVKKTKSSRTYNVSGKYNLDIVSKSRKLLLFFFFSTQKLRKNLPLIKFYIELTSGLLHTSLLDHYLTEKLI